MIIAIPDSLYIPHGAVRVISERRAREMGLVRQMEIENEQMVDYLVDRSSGNRTKLEWRSGILTLPAKQGIVAKKLKIPAEMRKMIKQVMQRTEQCNISLGKRGSEAISLTESEWKQAYAAGAIQPNVPFLGAKLHQDCEEEKYEEERDELMLHTSRLGIDAIAE